jgi:DNA-binding CsgD family transcriptional regulator
MGGLDHGDLEAVHNLALRAYACEGLDSFRASILPELRSLVPGEMLGYNDLDLSAGRVIVLVDPPGAGFDGLVDAFAATAHQHPGLMLTESGDYRPHLLSDFLTTSELHRLDLYNEVYRVMGSEDQIYFNLAPPAMVTIVINRSRRTFTERDREVIEVLEPHLSRAFMQAQHRERAQVVIAAQDAGLRETDAALVLIDPSGSVVHASTLARDLLGHYYPGRRDISGVLPEALAEWLRNCNPDMPAVTTVTGAYGRLQVRAISGHTPQGWRVVLLDEVRGRLAPSVTSLRRLGLTDRQAQVLRLLCTGSRTEMIAQQLYVSPATVRKHLENIYTRLGVRSRTEAVAIAMRQRPE